MQGIARLAAAAPARFRMKLLGGETEVLSGRHPLRTKFGQRADAFQAVTACGGKNLGSAGFDQRTQRRALRRSSPQILERAIPYCAWKARNSSQRREGRGPRGGCPVAQADEVLRRGFPVLRTHGQRACGFSAQEARGQERRSLGIPPAAGMRSRPTATVHGLDTELPLRRPDSPRERLSAIANPRGALWRNS